MDSLEEETEQFESLSMDMAKKESFYKANWAREYLSAKGSIKEREAWADYKLADEHFDYKISSVRASMDAIRTLNANVRSQV